MGDDRGPDRASSSVWNELRGRLHGVLERFGLNNDALLLMLKSVVAATLAWFIAEDVLGAPSSTFAPFSAVLMIHATVSRSVNHSLRYVTAMVGGVVLAGILLPLLGPAVWTFALLVVSALLLGQWRRLGSHGSQVTVAAMFSYAAFFQASDRTSSWMQLASITGLIVLGCVIGVVTNLAIVPPLRYRTAEHGVQTLAHTLARLLEDITERLRSGELDANQAESWWERASEFRNTVAQTRYSVEDAAETVRLNPRRLLLRRGPSFAGHRSTVSALGSHSEQIYSITRALNDISQAERLDSAQKSFLVHYADTLEAAASGIRVLGDLHTYQDLREENELDDRIEQGRSAHRSLSELIDVHHLDKSSRWPVYEALQIDGRRLVEELAQAEHELARLESTSRPRGP
ncbi:FUSC family protein [Haloactinomyces albus]|uniref:Aromatic acid exporter family member 1 n=1 Tax=Haloactinomyces albus TaxID=1352928 RepID=A0AAE3ZDA4_9ACTN|nr:aromatic acid exporter family protein [Haloactinomyces albus]MDR7301429.1 hypothetical protein [Haloactinomyces albus]